MKEISIIIATFNASKTIKRCLDSIIIQKEPSVEIIIIDGLSTDSTEEIVQTYGNEIDIFISESDLGIYDAWNKGISVSSGNWIMFVGADDILLPNSIKEIFQFISLNNVNEIDYISAKNIYTDENGKYIKIIGEEYSWNKMKRGMCVAHVASLHSRKLFNEIGLYSLKYKICDDYDLLLRKKNKLKTLFINKEIAKMQIGGMSFSLRALKEVFKIRSAHSTQSVLNNYILFIKDLLLFYTFKPRKKLYNYFINDREK